MADAFSELLSRLAEQHKRDLVEAALPGSLAVRSLVEENRRLRQELEALQQRGELEKVRSLEAWPSSSENSAALRDEAGLATTLPGVPADVATSDGGDSTGPSTPRGPARLEPAPGKEARQRGPMPRQRRPSVGDVFGPAHSGREGRACASSNCAQIKRAVSALDYTHRNKQVRRIRRILDLRPVPGESLVVSVDNLYSALAKRRSGHYSMTDVAAIFGQLRVAGDKIGLPGAREDSESSARDMPFKVFVELMLMADLPSHVGRETMSDIADIQDVFLTDNIEDVIRRVSHGQTGIHLACETEEEAELASWLAALNNLGGATVVVSLLFLSFSLDYSPDWPGWVVFEALFLCSFILEIGGKVWLLGWKRFSCGPDWHLNWLDVFITTTALFDLVVSIATIQSHQSAARITMVLRVLRLSRVARLLKLLQTPLLTSLANLLAGFVIGLPWLLWVVVLLIVILFIMGVIFRYTLGPEGAPMLPVCGNGDDIDPDNAADSECKAHYLYGEEFFGTVLKSMFTVFRCMIGDCSTRGGQALTVHFSHGFGLRFEVTYFVGMVVVIFGLFNIITSIFVEATLSGLKHNDVQRKFHKLYEARYVEGKLKILVGRIQAILRDRNRPRTSSATLFLGQDLSKPLSETGNFSMSEAQFIEVMKDSVVNDIFDDLDVVRFNRAGLFEMFDTNGSGYISVVELVETLVKLRGDPQKSDMVAAWVGLRALHEKFECFQMLLLENQKMMLLNQDRLRNVVKPRASPSDEDL